MKDHFQYFITHLKYILPSIYLITITTAALYRLTPAYTCQVSGLFAWCTGWPETLMFLVSLPGILITLFLFTPLITLAVAIVNLVAPLQIGFVNQLFVPLAVLTTTTVYYGLGRLLDRSPTGKRSNI